MSEGSSQRPLAVLVGNGLSIAFNSELNLASITKEMIARMQAATEDGDKVVHAMNEIARRAVSDGEVTDEDFEKLVGAFDSQVLTLDELRKLADLVASDDTELRQSIKDVANFSQSVRDNGISYVLEVIVERSYANWTRDGEMHDLIEAMVEDFGGSIHIGNLNYDTLLLSALKAVDAPMCDMGHGYERFYVVVKDDDDPDDEGVRYQVNRLRRGNDFPTGPAHRVKLLHLHGSLTYWRSMEREDLHFKAPIDMLRNHQLWAGLREGEPRYRPAVVLANQRDKAHHVGRYPFKLAYEVFADGLSQADHWLIIGYSFRDACVNDILREEFIRRKDKPTVLVSTFGDDLDAEEVERAFGWGAEDEDSSPWLTINRLGAAGLETSTDWTLFTG
ncbi:SIR2 family protein [Paenarthrobacter nicotinovorans]|uniref:SIR2 family protein n=1 Tax=Paenarthrobacter nicotinovorans TaxID=29320 RepID=UPI0009ED1AC0|nr:SIR2 family protein [Paenarthrobacter nicotinovorans]